MKVLVDIPEDKVELAAAALKIMMLEAADDETIQELDNIRENIKSGDPDYTVTLNYNPKSPTLQVKYQGIILEVGTMAIAQLLYNRMLKSS